MLEEFLQFLETRMQEGSRDRYTPKDLPSVTYFFFFFRDRSYLQNFPKPLQIAPLAQGQSSNTRVVLREMSYPSNCII